VYWDDLARRLQQMQHSLLVTGPSSTTTTSFVFCVPLRFLHSFGGQLVDKLVVSLVDKKYQKPVKTAYHAERKRVKRQHGLN
jgi:hypothetical protein